MAKIGGKIGVWLGLYDPVGIDAPIRCCSMDQGRYHAKWNIREIFFWDLLVPRSKYCKIIRLFCTDHVHFTGIEMSSVYITRLAHPVKTYIRGIFAALVFYLC